jgi:hypothetical protein
LLQRNNEASAFLGKRLNERSCFMLNKLRRVLRDHRAEWQWFAAACFVAAGLLLVWHDKVLAQDTVTLCVYGVPPSGYDACCGDNAYDSATQGCCNGQIYALATQGCCPGANGQVYDLATQACCVNGEPYDPTTHGCCEDCCGSGAVYPLVSPDDLDFSN